MDLFYAVLFEIPSVLLVYFLIDNQLCGRIKLLSLGSFGCAVAFTLIWWFEEQFLVLSVIIFQFFIRIIFLSFVPLVAESYSTQYRSLGQGFSFSLGRLSGATAPLLIYPLYVRNHYTPFLSAFIALFFILGVSLFYPLNLTNKPLDQKIQEEKQTLEQKKVD